MNALALTYHDVVDPGQAGSSGFRGRAADAYKLDRPEFERQLDAIARIAPSGAVQLVGEPPNGSLPVFLTFDDGGANAAHIIAPLLQRYGWRGHFMVPTDYIGRPGFLTREQIRDLRRRGHVIGSHSGSHPHLIASRPWHELLDEWTTSAAILADILSEPVQIGSLPGDDYSKRVAEAAAAAGFRVIFTSIPTTSVWTVEGCLVIGRYVVRPGMSLHRLAALASWNRWPRFHQAAVWTGKRVLKTVGRPILKRVLGSHPRESVR